MSLNSDASGEVELWSVPANVPLRPARNGRSVTRPGFR